MKRPALQNKRVGLLRIMVIRARKVFGTFEKRAPREGHEGGGVLIPFPSRLFFFLIPAQIPQSQPVLLKFKSHSHFLLFLFHESQSQCTKSHLPASKKGKSQLPFYPFTALPRVTRDHIALSHFSS